jgi:hypothetical protein
MNFGERESKMFAKPCPRVCACVEAPRRASPPRPIVAQLETGKRLWRLLIGRADPENSTLAGLAYHPQPVRQWRPVTGAHPMWIDSVLQ